MLGTPRNRDIDGKAREGRKASDQAWRDEGTMASRRQRILLRQRMHQRIDIAPHWCEETHGPRLTPKKTRPFFVWGP